MIYGVDRFFGHGGVLSQKLDGYEDRPSQVDLARRIEASISKGQNIIAEGCTGVGKSLAYILGGLNSIDKLNAVRQDAMPTADEPDDEGDGGCVKVTIATGNIVLQEQLFSKDLPFVRSIVGDDFTFALAKGRNNYLCKQLHEERKQSSNGLFGADENAEILKWGDETETGDKSELDFEPGIEWSKFSVTKEECLGQDCDFHSECFANRAKAKWASADVLVCNYHLLLADAKVCRETDGHGSVLPPSTVLVCDEAHKLPDIARSFYGWQLTRKGVISVANMLHRMKLDTEPVVDDLYNSLGMTDREEWNENHLGDIAHEVDKTIDKFFKAVEKFGETSKGSIRTLDKPLQLGPSVEALSGCLYRAGLLLGFAAKGVGDSKEKKRVNTQAKSAGENAARLKEFLAMKNRNYVYFVERYGKSNSYRLVCRMIDVANELWDTVFVKRPTVVTSATLAVNGGFEYIRKEMGLKKANEFISGSPFDYENQGMIILSKNAPDPKARDIGEFHTGVIRAAKAVVEVMDGRTLFLFTSYKMLNMVKEEFGATYNGYRVLCQGDLPRMKLIEEFKSDVSSILLGTESFWAGVDVRGEALSCVFIDKLPFKAPGDPVWDARCARNENWFFELMIPEAIIQLKQGVGRLIRSKTDRGVVVITDNRLVTKGYGSQIVNSLPLMKRARSLRSISGFLGIESDPQETLPGLQA